jgi:hypothetical protein
MVKIGIIGGSGLDNPDILKDAKEIAIETPYGPPTSALTCGAIKGVDAVIIARHGKDHSIYPSAYAYSGINCGWFSPGGTGSGTSCFSESVHRSYQKKRSHVF